jgi:hypothetical protein
MGFNPKSEVLVVDQLKDFLKAGASYDRDTAQGQALPAIVDRLRAGGAEDWAGVIEARVANEHMAASAGDLAAEILMGRACGELCGRNPGEEEFTLVRQLREACTYSSADFLETAERTLRSSAEAQDRLRTMLRQRAEVFATDPERTAHIFKGDIHHLITDISRLRFVDVWAGPNRHTMAWLHDHEAYDLLR